MKVPKDLNNFDADEYPHFQVFCNAQLCRPIKFHGKHWENAKVIAKIPEKKIREVKSLTWSRPDSRARSRCP